MQTRQTDQTEQIEALLHRFGLARDRMRVALARATGLAAADLDALEYLEADGPLTQRELGERLLLTSGAVTMLVDRLEHAGRVRRLPHPTDRRALLIELGPKAAQEAPSGLRDYHARLARLSGSVPAAHRAAVAGFLKSAAESAEQAGDELHRAR